MMIMARTAGILCGPCAQPLAGHGAPPPGTRHDVKGFPVLRTRLAVLPAALVLVGSLAACGGGSPAAQPSTPAPATSSSAPEVEALTAENIVARLDAAQHAVTSYDLTMTSTGVAAMEATGSADLADGKQNVSMVMSSPDMGEIEVRFVDGVIYLNMGPLTGGLFLKADPKDPTNELAAGFAGFEDDILGAEFKGMEDAITSVTATGEPEEIDGVQTQAYDVVIDTTKIAADVAEGLVTDGALDALPATLTYTYWVDADDVPRKIEYDIAGMTTTITMHNIGAGAPVVAPSADEITTEMPF
jgi:hypothetical protein